MEKRGFSPTGVDEVQGMMVAGRFWLFPEQQ
jgi:hypothetical protein